MAACLAAARQVRPPALRRYFVSREGAKVRRRRFLSTDYADERRLWRPVLPLRGKSGRRLKDAKTMFPHAKAWSPWRSWLFGEALETRGFFFAEALPAGGDLGDNALVFGLAAFFGPWRGLQVRIEESVGHGQVVAPCLEEEIVAELGEITALAEEWRRAWPEARTVVVQVEEAVIGRIEAGVAGEEIAVDEVVGVETLELGTTAGEDVFPGWGVLCLEQFFDGRQDEFSADEEFVRVAPGTAPAAGADDGLWAEVPFAEHCRAGAEDTLTTGGHHRPAEGAEHLTVFDNAVIFSAHVFGVERTAFGLVSGDGTAGQIENDFGVCFLQPGVDVLEGWQVLPVGVDPAVPAMRLERYWRWYRRVVWACHAMNGWLSDAVKRGAAGEAAHGKTTI